MQTAISRSEFIALMAMLTATVALSIDAMLPALPTIGAELSPDDPNRAQLIVTSFVLGMGMGTFVSGPLSDAFGRKPVMICGAFIYIAAAVVCSMAQSLEVLLAARIIQGIGASGPRVVAVAVIRDLYAGRGMAKILSFVMIVFALVPAIAPLLGDIVIGLSGWRAIFFGFVGFSAVSIIWLTLRLPETLDGKDRRAFRLRELSAGASEVLRHPIVRLSIMVQTLCFAMLFSMLSSVQPIFDVTFDRAESFPLWFGFVAVVAASSGFVNAALVVRLGMMVIVRFTLAFQVGLSALMVALGLAANAGVLGTELFFYIFVAWQVSLFFLAGTTIGNLMAIAQEPMGHIAGMAASMISALATVGAVFFAAPVGLMFDGTPLPLAIAVFLQSIAGLGLMQMMMQRNAEQTA